MSLEGNEHIDSIERSRRNDIVRSLLRALEEHAPGERAHAERVAVYSVAAGELLGMSDEKLLNLRYAAELHDIGKLLIDFELLSAERPLELRERILLERHVTDFESLLPQEDFLKAAVPLIRHHHERWSGRGYPDALCGDEIPLGARIIGAAEAFDVMLEGASWRTPFSEDVAISAMEGLRGTWFDPEVVDALLKVQPLVQPVRAA